MSYCVTHDFEWDDDDEESAKEALNHNKEVGCEVTDKKPANKEETFSATKTTTTTKKE